MQARAKYRIWSLFEKIGLGILQALAFVWVGGLLLEAMKLTVSLATDVHALRSHEEQERIKKE